MRISQFNMSVILFLTLACLGRWEIVTADIGPGAAPGKRPNVLLIYTDDHAQWAVGVYGNREV